MSTNPDRPDAGDVLLEVGSPSLSVRAEAVGDADFATQVELEELGRLRDDHHFDWHRNRIWSSILVDLRQAYEDLAAIEKRADVLNTQEAWRNRNRKRLGLKSLPLLRSRKHLRD